MFAYHYTNVGAMAGIMESGFIAPSTFGVPANERPIVWFSTHETWEPTARTPVRKDERAKWTLHTRPSLRKMAESTKVPFFRLAVDAENLTPWRELRANFSYTRAKKLEDRARHMGAKPSDWMGTFTPVAMREIPFAEIYAAGLWTPIIRNAEMVPGWQELIGGGAAA